MRYQLVLQFPSSSINEYDAFVEIEDLLAENLKSGSEIDGHDIGSDEFNIFILTDNPQESFGQVKTIVGGRPHWRGARVAYREVDGSRYTILWPNGLTEFSVG